MIWVAVLETELIIKNHGLIHLRCLDNRLVSSTARFSYTDKVSTSKDLSVLLGALLSLLKTILRWGLYHVLVNDHCKLRIYISENVGDTESIATCCSQNN